MSKSTIVLTVLVFTLSLIPQFWFPGKTILLGYDNVYPLAPISFLYDRMYSWSWVIGFGSDQSGIQGSLIIHAIDAIPQFLGFSYQESQKIVYCFWFFLILFSAYILLRVLEKNNFISSPYVKYFFPVLYAINFYTLQAWWIVERTKFSLLVATPLILSVVIPMMKKELNLKQVVFNSVLCCLVLFVFNGGGWLGISLFGGLLVLLFSFYIFSIFSYLHSKKYKQIIFLHIFFIFFILGFLLINAYTIFPFLFTTLFEYSQLLQRSGGLEGVTGWTRYLSEHTSIINLLRFQGIPDWYNTSYHAYASAYLRQPLLIIGSFIFPILIFFSFLSKKVERNFLRYILLSLLLSLFFTAGIHKPLGGIFELMMLKIPGFIVFRSAIFKFGYSYWLVASLLVSIGLSEGVRYLSQRFFSKYHAAFFSTILSSLIVILILLYHFPFLTGDFFHVDKNYASSRVQVPSYVSDFSRWWQLKGRENRVLLLPRLNENWHFEIYKWRYLSLNPVLANFGNEGIVENSVLLTPEERDLVNQLYDAINESDSVRISSLTSILGIRYFLLRKDFSHNYPGIETDDPSMIEKKLSVLPDLSKQKDYGNWTVYRLSNEKHFFSTTSIAYVSDHGFEEDFPDNNALKLDKKLNLPISRLIVHPICMSCAAEQVTTPVKFPKPKILLDSNLYQLIELRGKINSQKNMTFDDGLYQLVGESLKYASQIKELIEQDRGDYYVHLARERYLIALTSLGQRTNLVLSQSSNPYTTSIILQDYSKAQIKFLSDLLLKASRKDQQIDLELIMNQLEVNRRKLEKIIKKDDFNKKIYTVSIDESGIYNVALEKNSLGFIDNPMEVRLKVGNSILTPKEGGKLLQFGDIAFAKGKTEFSLSVPSQKSVLLPTEKREYSGRVCYVSTIKEFRIGKIYNLEFSVKNNFDPNFLFFVDDAIEYNPILLGYLSVSGEEIKPQRYILSSANMPIKKTAKTIRIGFCAPSLTQARFIENVRGLQVTELTSSVIQLTKDRKVSIKPPPSISVERKGYLAYSVNVQNAATPYFLIFSSRYSSSWNATIGDHMVGNQFQNTWFVDKTGNYKIDINYDAQKYTWIGLVVSVISLVIGSGIIYSLRRKR